MEKRSNRISILRPASIEINAQRFEVVVKDVSFGGVRFVTDLRPEAGNDVILLDDRLGSIEGKVIRQTEDGFVVYLGQSRNAANYALRNVAAEILDTV